MTQRLMIIGGDGWGPFPIVNAAKELGIWVLATYYPHDASRFQRYPDTSEVLHPKDVSGAIKLFKEYRIDKVISDSDDAALYTAAVICREFNLPGPNLGAATISTNKKILREKCEKAGIRQPKFYTGRDLGDLSEGVEYVGGFPVVIKPVDNQGGRGVRKIEREDQLQEAFFCAITSSYSREFIVEKFIPGTVIIVEGISTGHDTHTVLAISSKTNMDDNRLLTAEITYPPDLHEDSLLIKVTDLHYLLVKTLHYDFGLAHSEFIVDARDDNIWLLEATNRGGRHLISSLLLPSVIDVDLSQYLIRMALGDTTLPKVTENLTGGNAAKLILFNFGNGKIRKISGAVEVKTIPGVLRCELSVKEGDILSPTTPRHGALMLVAKSKEEIKGMEQKVKHTLRVKFE